MTGARNTQSGSKRPPDEDTRESKAQEDEVLPDDSNDEEFDEVADTFESSYNFRFEEPYVFPFFCRNTM